MSLNNFKLNIFLIFILLSIILITYVNYLFFGGFGSGDDINYVLKSLDNNYTLIESIKNEMLGNQASRVIGFIIREITIFFLKDNATLYILSNITIWFIAIIFIGFVLLEFFNKNIVYIFILLASFPFFATSIFAGPYLFTEHHFSILFWSISLFFIIKFSKNKKIIFLLNGLLFLMLSLMILEYIIPLLFLTVCLPILYEISKINYFNKKLMIMFFLFYVLPIVFICLLFLFFKIYFVTLYANVTNVYGVTPISLKSFLQAFYYFFVIFIEVPLLLIEIIPHLIKLKLIIVAFLLVIFLFVLKKYSGKKIFKQNTMNNYNIKKPFIIVLIISLLLSCIIFFISFYPATTFGYYNKMMVPSFICFSILVSLLLNYLNTTRYFFISVVISVLWISSMTVQLDNFVKSWKLRDIITKDISNKIYNIKFDDEYILIANVPYFLNKNYNNERVFFTIRNFEAHLNLLDVSVKAIPISHRILSDVRFYPNHNLLNKLDTISDEMNFFYYQFEEDKEKSNIEYIGYKNELLKKIERIKLNKINYHPVILREKIRLRFIKFVENNINQTN